MKNFILKIILFSLFPVAGFFLFHHAANLILDDSCVSLETESKIARFKLHASKTNIIVAGDSRAERQLIPRIIAATTGCHAVNIAVASGDLVTTLYAIKNSYKGSRNLFIISASSWQINDGAVDMGYLSAKSFQKMTMLERFHLFAGSLQDLNDMYKGLAKNSFAYLLKPDIFLPEINAEIVSENGFNGKTGTIPIKTDELEISRYLSSHPWYKQLSNQGVRWKIFEKAFKELGTIDSHFIIFQPPVSPYWKKIIHNTPIEQSELYYAQKLKELALESNNIDFYDFYAQEIPGLDDSMYYDPQHLNKDGAAVFSNFLADLISPRIPEMVR